MSYEKLPEGEYTGCSIPLGDGAQIQFGESQSGKAYARVKLGITEGSLEGQSIIHDLYLTGATIERSIKALRALGFTGDKLADFLNQAPSKTVAFMVAHEEYKDRMYAKVKRIGPAPKKLDSATLDKLSAEFSGVLVAPAPLADPEDELGF